MKLLVDGAQLQCTHGSKNSELAVPPTNVGLVGQATIATIADFAPVTNIAAFGTCSATGGACVPATSRWFGESAAFEINGVPALTEQSFCACTAGGTIRPVAAGQDLLEVTALGRGGTTAGGPDKSEASSNNPKEKKKPHERSPAAQPEIETFMYQLRLHDERHEPCAAVGYRLELESGEIIQGTTDGAGLIQQQLPKRRQSIRVVYAPRDPKFEIVRDVVVVPELTSGADYLAQLRNMGFDESDEHRTILSFQAAHPDLALTGALDEKTRTAIREMNDGQLKRGA
ncbi:DUF4280 domain-containing protein [Pendulispora rubella]|uniref:DUF4280 domain-containing protein n=1 Tax=Pendulispora rubella TaxID=2741070 RepID=A0ABZ2LH09_9BACT